MVMDTTIVSTRSWELLLVIVPQHGSGGWLMRGCALADPLGAQVICQLGLLSGYYGEDVLGKFSR
jgi:hypothetical protein